ncbi:MAG TPA: DUF4245 domain-containing protein [Kineosporiaceae bacterium]
MAGQDAPLRDHGSGLALGAGRFPPPDRGPRATHVRHLALSVLLVLALATAIWAMVPRPNSLPIHDVDVAGAARLSAPGLSFAPAVPRGLPPGWVPTSAGVRASADGVRTWHVGFSTPEGHYASIEQAARVTDQWESIMDSGGVTRPAQVVDGTTWEQRFKDVRDVTALIHRGEERTTMVTSKGGGLANAEVLARSIPATLR